MNDFNGKCYFSGSDSSETLWRIFKKFCPVDYVGDPTPHANVGVNRFNRERVCVCVKLSPSGIYFFLSFLGPMRTVGPSMPLRAQTTCPVGIRIPYMVWIIKINIFHIFYRKIWKIALQPMATLKSYNSGTFENTCTLFAPNWVFWGQAIKWCPLNLPLIVPCCHGNQPPLF